MPIFDLGLTYLTVEDILEIAGGLAASFAGTDDPFELAVLSPGGLESAASQPRQWFGGVELHVGVFRKAAALARGIICDHPLADGNKRTGMESASVFLALNGWELALPADDYVSLALGIAGDMGGGVPPLEVCEIAERLESHSTWQGI